MFEVSQEAVQIFGIPKCLQGSQNVYKDPKMFTRISKCLQGSQNVYKDPKMFTRIPKCLQGSQNVYKDPKYGHCFFMYLKHGSKIGLMMTL